MASPSDTPQPPKKPTPPVGKPAGSPPQKPQATGKPAPGAKPPAPQPKPASAKAGDGKVDGKDGKSGETKKPSGGVKKGAPPAKPVPAREAAHGAGRRFGQVLIDLGFIDEEQLWDILEEAKNTNQLTGHVAVARGLITEEQLLAALADQHGLKVIELTDFKPQNEATTLVPETMASVYKILPISYRDKVLTVAISDPGNMSAMD